MPRALALLLAVALAGPAVAETLLPLPTTLLVLKDGADAKARFFKVRSSTKVSQIPPDGNRIAPPLPGGPGDPTLHGATLTVVNAAGRSLVWSTPLPAARWSIIGSPTNFKGWFFKDDTPADGPVFRIYVKHDKLFVMGGRANWGYLLDALPQERVAARLTMGTELSWCVEGPAKSSGGSTAAYDNPTKFFTPRTPAMPDCAPLP